MFMLDFLYLFVHFDANLLNLFLKSYEFHRKIAQQALLICLEWHFFTNFVP